MKRARDALAVAPMIVEPAEDEPKIVEPPPRVVRRRAPTKPAVPAPQHEFARGRELAALLFFAAAVFLLLALASYDERGGADWVGPVGASTASIVVSAIGWVAWAAPLELALFALPFIRRRPSVITPARLAGDVVLVVTASALVHVGAAGRPVFGGHTAGGVVGELFGEMLRSLFSTVGTFLVGLTVIALVLISRAAFSFIAFANRAGETGAIAATKAAASVRDVAEAWQQAKALERAEGRAPAIVGDGSAESERSSVVPPDPDDRSGVRPRLNVREDDAVPKEAHEIARQLAGLAPSTNDDPPSGEEAIALVTGEPSEPAIAPTIVLSAVEPAKEKEKPKRGKRKAEEPTIAPPSPDAAVQKEESPVAALLEEASPIEVDVTEAIESEPTPVNEIFPVDESPAPKRRVQRIVHFEVPKAELLDPPPPEQQTIDKSQLLKEASALVETLATYKVTGNVCEIHPGPVVTTFEFEPKIGTKVREVERLANDLRLSLAKESVRIIAPIPGKNRIGFELPNAQRVPVNFRELIEDRRFADAKGALPVVLGRDIVGAPVYEDLAAMPHLLVAGATGAGKSVGLNVMLTSMLFRLKPEDLRFIMVDPKVVELAPFDRIPHMLLPVVTDMKKALNALKWCVDEMERRYQLLAQAGVKNISSYNAWRKKIVDGVVPNPLPRKLVAIDHNGLPEEIVSKDPNAGEVQYPEKLPYLVVVVDEFADLMMSVGKGEVEPPIARLAQKARAAGIHVILATQRPSVDVITGMIKANFPTRIAFRVTQRVDSRTILDAQGAEYLLGKGDMLASINGKTGLKRIQCPFVSEEEVQRLTDMLRAQGEPVFDESILDRPDEDGGDDGEMDEALSPKDQELYDRAIDLVREARKCSTSWLQRKMGLGYNKAARFVDRMERTGVVGPAVGAGKDREVLV